MKQNWKKVLLLSVLLAVSAMAVPLYDNPPSAGTNPNPAVLANPNIGTNPTVSNNSISTQSTIKEFGLTVGKSFSYSYPIGKANQKTMTFALNKITYTPCPSNTIISGGDPPADQGEVAMGIPQSAMPILASCQDKGMPAVQLRIQFEPVVARTMPPVTLEWNEPLRLADQYVIQLDRVKGETAWFLLYKETIVPVVSTAISMPIQIGTGDTVIIVQPTKVNAITGIEQPNAVPQALTTYEISAGISQIAAETKEIQTVNIVPGQPVWARVITSSGSTLQELPAENPVTINYKNTVIRPTATARTMTTIQEKEAATATELPLEITGNQLFAKTATSKTPVKILPEEAETKMTQANPRIACNTMELVSTANNQAAYACTGTVNGNLFGLIATSYETTLQVQAETGEVQENRPWWSALVFS